MFIQRSCLTKGNHLHLNEDIYMFKGKTYTLGLQVNLTDRQLFKQNLRVVPRLKTRGKVFQGTYECMSPKSAYLEFKFRIDCADSISVEIVLGNLLTLPKFQITVVDHVSLEEHLTDNTVKSLNLTNNLSNSWYDGIGKPTNDIGFDSDYYLDITLGDIYTRKSMGVGSDKVTFKVCKAREEKRGIKVIQATQEGNLVHLD